MFRRARGCIRAAENYPPRRRCCVLKRNCAHPSACLARNFNTAGVPYLLPLLRGERGQAFMEQRGVGGVLASLPLWRY